MSPITIYATNRFIFSACNANSYRAIGFLSSNIFMIFDAERMSDFGSRINGLLGSSSSLRLTCALLNAEG